MNSTLEDLGTHDAVVSYDVCDVLQQDASVHCTKSEVEKDVVVHIEDGTPRDEVLSSYAPLFTFAS